MGSPSYPGTPEHQHLLRGIADYYAADERVLAVAVFGSLGRGTWDRYSDIDLDVVLGDRVALEPVAEATRLFDALGQHAAVIIPDRHEAVDIVLASLMELSIRYHPLETTSPHIVDDLLVLTGRVDRAAIVAAGLANRMADHTRVADVVGACIRLLVTADGRLHRRQCWVAYMLVHLAREQLLHVFAMNHGSIRPYHAFDAADRALQARFGKTLPGESLASIQLALVHLLDILDQDLAELSAGQVRLTEVQHQLLDTLRARQAVLDLAAPASAWP